MNVTLIGIDLAKRIFQVCGVNRAGNPVFNRPVRRHQLMGVLAQYPGVRVVMEACSGSNYWGRELQTKGDAVMLIPPQHVKPFVKGNKNDRNDALAICEAAGRPKMRSVQPRSLLQTDMILVHRVRERRVNARTGLINQLRGLLNEYGVVVASGRQRLRRALPALLEDAHNGLTVTARRYLHGLLQEWRGLDQAIGELDQAIKTPAKASPPAQRLTRIKGVIPREHSSGGKQHLGAITKRGNRYLRRLLIQGAWAVIRYAPRSDDRLSCWARQVMARRGKHKAAVAVANKLARIIWAMLYHQCEYRPV